MASRQRPRAELHARATAVASMLQRGSWTLAHRSAVLHVDKQARMQAGQQSVDAAASMALGRLVESAAMTLAPQTLARSVRLHESAFMEHWRKQGRPAGEDIVFRMDCTPCEDHGCSVGKGLTHYTWHPHECALAAPRVVHESKSLPPTTQSDPMRAPPSKRSRGEFERGSKVDPRGVFTRRRARDIPDEEEEAAAVMPHARVTVPHNLYLWPSSIPGAGMGVFAKVALRPGQVLGEYVGRRLASGASGDYVLEVAGAGGFCIDASDEVMSNWARYLNGARRVDGSKANVRFVDRDGRVEVVVLPGKGIAAGQELLVDYGDSYRWPRQ